MDTISDKSSIDKTIICWGYDIYFSYKAMEWHTKQVWLKGDALEVQQVDVLAMSLLHPKVLLHILAQDSWVHGSIKCTGHHCGNALAIHDKYNRKLPNATGSCFLTSSCIGQLQTKPQG